MSINRGYLRSISRREAASPSARQNAFAYQTRDLQHETYRTSELIALNRAADELKLVAMDNRTPLAALRYLPDRGVCACAMMSPEGDQVALSEVRVREYTRRRGD